MFPGVQVNTERAALRNPEGAFSQLKDNSILKLIITCHSNITHKRNHGTSIAA